MTGRQPFLRTALPERGAAAVPCPGLAYHRARLPPSAIAEIYFHLRFDGGLPDFCLPRLLPSWARRERLWRRRRSWLVFMMSGMACPGWNGVRTNGMYWCVVPRGLCCDAAWANEIRFVQSRADHSAAVFLRSPHKCQTLGPRAAA